MKTLITSCLVALLAAATFVGTAQAATTSIEKWFTIIGETDQMITEVGNDLAAIETRVAEMDAFVDYLYNAYNTGSMDDEDVKAGLDKVAALAVWQEQVFEGCLSDLRACEVTLGFAVEAADRFKAEGDPAAELFALIVKNCGNHLNEVEASCGPCHADFLLLDQRIEELYALLTLP